MKSSKEINNNAGNGDPHYVKIVRTWSYPGPYFPHSD